MSASSRAAPVAEASVNGTHRGERGPVDARGLIQAAPSTRRAFPWLPGLLVPGRIYQGPLGELLIARADGGLDFVERGGRPQQRRQVPEVPVSTITTLRLTTPGGTEYLEVAPDVADDDDRLALAMVEALQAHPGTTRIEVERHDPPSRMTAIRAAAVKLATIRSTQAAARGQPAVAQALADFAQAMGRPVDPSARGLVQEAVGRLHQVMAEAQQQRAAPRSDARAAPARRLPSKPRLRGSRKG